MSDFKKKEELKKKIKASTEKIEQAKADIDRTQKHIVIIRKQIIDPELSTLKLRQLTKDITALNDDVKSYNTIIKGSSNWLAKYKQQLHYLTV